LFGPPGVASYVVGVGISPMKRFDIVMDGNSREILLQNTSAERINLYELHRFNSVPSASKSESADA
jgi:hypothetical protein